jgi:hypothetical protein
MAKMKRQYITRLEAHLEQIIEGTFAGLFGNKIRAQDVALRLARAMENGLEAAQDGDSRAIAPDQYEIYAHPGVQTYLLQQHPQLADTLAGHIVDMAAQAGYILNQAPQVSIIADESLEIGELRITTTRSSQRLQSTMAMERVAAVPAKLPRNARLVIDNDRTTDLTDEIVNIGRHYENTIILDDPQVSRFHVQLRLRFGMFVLFDLQSQSGTFVNGVRVEQHALRSGDLVQLGQTRLIYLDDTPSNANTDQTNAYPPVIP